MKYTQLIKFIDIRYVRLVLAAFTMILFILSAAAPGSPGDVGLR